MVSALATRTACSAARRSSPLSFLTAALCLLLTSRVLGAESPISAQVAPAPADQATPAWASASGTDQYGSWAELTVGKATQRFRYIHSGTFIMGSPQSEKDVALASDPGCKPEDMVSEVQHEVTISRGYWLADSTCSQGLWYTLMPAAGWFDAKRPLARVSWEDCQVFIKKLNEQVSGLGARLPTEAEWEYACRAGTITAFSFGPFGATGYKLPSTQYHMFPLKSLPPNAWGLYEMHGNLWQWCNDWFGDYATGAQRDPVGPTSGTYRVMRGGCFLDLGWRCRSAYRNLNHSDVRLSGLSFRLALGGLTPAPVAVAPDQPAQPAPVSNDPAKPAWATATGADALGNWADLTIGSATQRFRFIKPGTFTMGSPQTEKDAALACVLLEYKTATRAWFDSEVQHEVTLTKGYWMADCQCSQGFWTVVMGGNPARHRRDNLPADQICWTDSQEFCRKLSARVPGLMARLPTEAEWEYACRAGTITAFNCGAIITPEQVRYNGRHEFAGNCKGPCPNAPTPVKSLPPNAWGLHEMHGNMRQWCSDWLADLPATPQTDPTGPKAATGNRVFKGGAWYESPYMIRSAARGGKPDGYVEYCTGFRIVVTATP